MPAGVPLVFPSQAQGPPEPAHRAVCRTCGWRGQGGDPGLCAGQIDLKARRSSESGVRSTPRGWAGRADWLMWAVGDSWGPFEPVLLFETVTALRQLSIETRDSTGHATGPRGVDWAGVIKSLGWVIEGGDRCCYGHATSSENSTRGDPGCCGRFQGYTGAGGEQCGGGRGRAV